MLAATKVVMGMLGVDVGPVRQPHVNLTPEQQTAFRKELDQLGFFDWIASESPRAAQPAVSPISRG